MTQIIGQRYQILEQIGVGGMGAVFQATDLESEQTVAVKHLKPELANTEVLERFRREGEALRVLDHPNIVKFYNTIEENGENYLVMEYCPEGDLRQQLDAGSLPIQDVLNIAIDLADALTRAHRLHIIHRDLKPANILLSHDGTPRLTDFGIAFVTSQERITQTNMILGTINYLAPEIINGETIDNRADIWAFGVILYEMLTGQNPFAGDTISHTLSNILTQPPPDTLSQTPEIPVELTTLIHYMLEKDRDHRLPSVRHVGVVLEDIISGRESKPLTVARSVPTPIPVQTQIHNLSADMTPFIGREAELDRLRGYLADGNVRLISIVGMGGMGKTRLALEASRQQIGHFEAGVFFVPLVKTSSPENIPNIIAEAIGFHFHSSEPPIQQLINYLHQKHMLQILDNFEHLLSSSTMVTDILRGAPLVKVLVTTRQRLRLRGETILNISGMEVQAWETADQASQAGVVKLFMQSAQRLMPDMILNDENLPTILGICQAVQGMPLAVELAASWVDMFSLDEIQAGINQETDFLTSDFQDIPERHRSVRAVVEQSLRLLGDSERLVFIHLCIFQGGFTQIAAQSVANANLRILATLVNKSLLQRDAAGRYSIHELLRQMGETTLKNDPERYASARENHTRYYCKFLADLDQQYAVGDVKFACQVTEPEMSNIHNAWVWASKHGMFADLILVQHSILIFREVQNRWQEVESWYETAITELANFPACPERDLVLSGVYIQKSWTALRLGQIEQGLAFGHQSWQYLQNSKLELAFLPGLDARSALTVLYTVAGNYEAARQIGEEMLAYHQNRNDRINAIGALYSLSALELAKGNYEKVQQYGQAALEHHTATGYRYMWSYLLNNWGNAERALGNFDEAQRLFRESYDNMRDLGHQEGMRTALNNLAQIAILQDEYDVATEIFNQNISTYRDIGDIGGIASALESLGRIAIRQEDYAGAAKLFSEALETVGSKLGSVTVSVLLRVSKMFLEADLQEKAVQLLTLISHHPASNQEIRAEAQQYCVDYVVQISDEIPSLEMTVDGVIETLNTNNWKSESNIL